LYPCKAQSEWEKMWEEIQNQIGDGSFDYSQYSLDGLGGIFGGDINIGLGGSKAFGKGGVFASGGIFDITSGGFLGGLFGNSFGFDEIHNDLTLNSNMTWAIAHSGYIRKTITDKQKKIMSLQDSINMSVKRLYELEKLTEDYLSTKQSDAVDIETYNDLFNITEDIGFYYNESSKLCNKSSDLNYVKERMTVIVVTRSTRIITKLLGFARVDGKSNLLNNEDRNEIVTYLIENLRNMRGTLAYTYRALLAGSNAKLVQSDEISDNIDEIYKKKPE